MTITSVDWLGRRLTLVDKVTGKEIIEGDEVKDFRGERRVVRGGKAPQHSGSTGKVWLDYGELFAPAIGAKWVRDLGTIHVEGLPDA